jgi:4-hydroxybenzoate polyprenyltransferase
LAIIAIRNFLEIFSDTAIVSFKLFPFSHQLFIPASVSIAISFLHYFLFWIALILLFTIIFTCITKENIDKTSRAVLSFSWVALISPLFDLAVSGGRGINLHYIYPKKIVDFFLPGSLTPGESLMAGIALILAFIYCAKKTKKIFKAILGTALIYLTVLVGSVLPFLIKQTAGILQIGLKSITPVLVIRLLVFVIFMELSYIFYSRNKSYFVLLLKSMGLLKTLHFILIFILGMLLIKGHIGRFILENAGSLLLSVISIALIWCLANIISNLTAQEAASATDKNFALGVFLVAAVCAISVNFPTLYFILLGAGASILYLAPPLKLKRFLLFSKLIISFSLFLLAVLGYLFAGGEILEFPHIFTLYFLVFFTACLNFADLKDYSVDKKAGIKTLPVILGEKMAKFVVGSFWFISYLLIPWLFLAKILFIPSLCLGALQFYLINRKNYQEQYVFLAHLAGLIGLLVWLNSFQILP